MRSISCVLTSFVVMYIAVHIKGSNELNMTVQGIFIVGAFILLVMAILFMIFGV